MPSGRREPNPADLLASPRYEQIVAWAARIRERAFVSRTMPPGNRTRITDEERALLGRWVAEGARGADARQLPR